MFDKTAVIFWSDPHQNHKFGLCPPGVEVYGKDNWKLNPPQEHLWYTWNICQDWVEKITAGYEKVGVSVGDAIENDTKVRAQAELISLNPSNALAIAHQTLDPLVQTLDYFFVIKGTPAHVGEDEWTEDELARDFDAVPDEDNHSPAWRHLMAEFSGVKFDIAHHPSGNSNITRNYQAVATRLAYDVQEAYVMKWGEVPPHYAIRGHLHRFGDSGIGLKTRGIILPGLQYKSHYLSRLGKDGDLPDTGMVVILCENGESELRVKIVRPEEKRKIWRIQKETTQPFWKSLLKPKS